MRQSTVKSVTLPVVLVVGCSPEVVEQCRQASKVAAAIVQESDAPTIATQAARWRPFAIVMPDALYDVDPREHEALAKDVGGRILHLSPGAPTKAIEALLLGAFLEWEQRRQKPAS